ncbi:pyridoxal phosphate biosynthetic protein [Erythrobacteraceae bacterium CFH 75059]|uniref:pyridoxal phosphate biosynthetic protein n=1 Tax=Qipengyuania thermophila TaxID=2509361 RepID=UPI00102061E2|nr:pyridoxal phosphate biosynthetic protein [Qipengyuania thermophila]TCD04938.1 pyridoxal phosphate biosynthetic protein [Erythrobacteraceae bacterium CFH 75059]
MTAPDDTGLRGAGLVLAAAAVPFLASLLLLGLAVGTGTLWLFAPAWLVFQVAGYAGAFRIAGGDVTHPLFKAQVALHLLVLALVAAVFVRAL